VGDLLWDGAAALLAVAVLYVLVRPSGDGPAMVTAFTGGLSDIVSFATAA
jgi:hypothetical protein